jgi:hypothetical protein
VRLSQSKAAFLLAQQSRAPSGGECAKRKPWLSVSMSRQLDLRQQSSAGSRALATGTNTGDCPRKETPKVALRLLIYKPRALAGDGDVTLGSSAPAARSSSDEPQRGQPQLNRWILVRGPASLNREQSRRASTLGDRCLDQSWSSEHRVKHCNQATGRHTSLFRPATALLPRIPHFSRCFKVASPKHASYQHS